MSRAVRGSQVPAKRAVDVGLVAQGALAATFLLVALYSLWVSDDPQEIVLDVVLLGLGLALAASLSTRRLQVWRHKLGHAERHLAVMAGSDVLSWECDMNGHIANVGPQAYDHFGYAPEEMLGLDARQLVHPQEYDRLASYLAAGTGWWHERWRCVCKDGTERWFTGSAVPSVAADGTLLGFIGSTQPLGRDALDEQRMSEIASRVYNRLGGDGILPVFQPILSVETGRMIGAEALSRFPGSDRTPDLWFAEASEVGLGVELELAALRRSLGAAHTLPDDVYVSLNVGPQTLVRPELAELLLSTGIPPYRLVLEITEHTSIGDYTEVLEALGSLRAAGVRLAVDDAGAGYASFRHILRLAPEIIKLDRSLIAGLHDDPALRALASAVVAFGREMGSSVTAEGIETPEELRCAQSLGIHAAQGYLFGRPTSDWTTWNEWHEHGPLYSVASAWAPAHT